MIQMTESVFLSSNGKNNVYYREYLPEGEARGIVQIAHGVAEHIARYDDFARFLCANGYIVTGNDHLGHGKTAENEEELGWFADSRGWELVLEDMHTLHNLIRSRHPGLPYYLFGHSMGSFLARTYIIRYHNTLDGVIISGTGHMGKALTQSGELMGRLECRRHGTRYKSKLLNGMAFGKYNDGFDAVRTASDWISSDPAVVDAYVADPLCGFIPSAGLFRDMMGGIAFITGAKNIERMRKELPVYFMSGDCDPVGEKGKGVIRAYKAFLKAGMKDVTMKLYAGGRHEMLNEVNRAEVYEDVLGWLESKRGH